MSITYDSAANKTLLNLNFLKFKFKPFITSRQNYFFFCPKRKVKTQILKISRSLKGKNRFKPHVSDISLLITYNHFSEVVMLNMNQEYLIYNKHYRLKRDRFICTCTVLGECYLKKFKLK